MDSNTTALERAFELARSGTYSSVSEIKAKLNFEGYYGDQITGRQLAKQLGALIQFSASLNEVPRGSKGQKRSADVLGKDKAAQSLGQRGGKARAEALSKGERASIAKKAGEARWKAKR